MKLAEVVEISPTFVDIPSPLKLPPLLPNEGFMALDSRLDFSPFILRWFCNSGNLKSEVILEFV
jgi:hypothetical protein